MSLCKSNKRDTMKKHIVRRAVVGMESSNWTRCGLPPRFATCDTMRGNVYDRERYKTVEKTEVCKTCLKATH